MKFEVITNIKTYEWDDSCVIGDIHIDIDGFAFPRRQWTDSLSEVLIMWAESFLSMLESILKSEEEFFFLDGPFSFIIRTNGASLAQLHLLENTKPLYEIPHEISFYSILYSVIQLIEKVIGDDRLKEVQQIKRLKNMSLRLKSAAQQYGYHMD